MKETTTNQFIKGINTDLAYARRTPDTYDDALNVRITANGTGMVAANIKGNDIAFQLSSGYVFLGAQEYMGVLYVVSYNPATKYGEIGTYPSPKYHTEGYDNVYRPLPNYTNDNLAAINVDDCLPAAQTLNLIPFSSPYLEFDIEHPAKIICKEEYDGSVNLYITDRKRPIRVLNSGFDHRTGLTVNRYTSSFMLQSGHHHLINESELHPIINLQQITNGGTLKAGNYFFYVRYVDQSYNATSFLASSAPVSVVSRVVTSAVHVKGLEGTENTDNTVHLQISNIDTASSYIEIAYVRYYNNVAEAYLIDNRYPTQGNSVINVSITGNESLINTDVAAVTTLKPSDALIAHDIDQMLNVFYMANTKGPELDHPDLRELGCKINLSEERVIIGTAPPMDAQNTVNPYGVNPMDVNQRVGYFSGESYCFALIPVMKGGFVGRPIAVRGFDNYTNTPVNTNTKGIFRFSSAEVVPYFVNGTVFGKGIKLQTGGASSFFTSSDWLRENIIGFYIARAERNRQLLYQGVSLRCINGQCTTDLTDGSTEENQQTEKWVPVFDGLWSMIVDGDGPDQEGYFHYTQMRTRTNNTRLAVVSSDYYLDRRDVPDSVHVKRIASTNYFNDWTVSYDSNNFNCTQPFASEAPTKPFDPTRIVGHDMVRMSPDTGSFTSRAINVLGWTVPTKQGFASKVSEGRVASDEGLFYYYRDTSSNPRDDFYLNMPHAWPDYIGLMDAPAVNGAGFLGTPVQNDGWHGSVVNVYRTDPLLIDYKTLYDPKNTLFSVISSFIPVSTFFANDQIAWQGDCFVTRSYIKLLNGYESELAQEFIDVINRNEIDYLSRQLPKGWGVWLSAVLEHSINPNYRVEAGRNKFYAGSVYVAPGKDFAWLLDSPESNLINDGYQRTLEPRAALGIDLLSPTSNNYFPTRIRPSQTNIFGGLKDAFRIFIPADSKDFDYSLGAIKAIVAFNDILYSIQERGINLHPVNERVQSQTDAGDSVTFATNEKLTQYKRTLSSKLGTQHTYSVVKGETGVYGFDYSAKVWWRIQGERVDNLGILKGADKWIRSIFASDRSDRMEWLPDKHSSAQGILGVYDSRNKEVTITIHLKEEAHSFCFSERLDNFMTRWSYTPRGYATITDDLFSFHDGYGWRHDSDDRRTNFYDQQYQWMVRWVTCPNPEMMKHWDNLTLNMNNVQPSAIRYVTQHQEAAQDPFIKEKWYQPFYRLNQWNLPIRRADSVVNESLNRFAARSPLRGIYLITQLEYDGADDLWMLEALTFFHKEPKY